MESIGKNMNTFLTKKAKSVKGRLKRYIIITIGAFFYAAAISLFLDPNKIAPGGVMGISILISHFCNIQSGTINMVLNIPIILLGLKKFGWRFMCSTVYSVFMISIFTNILSIHGALTDDLLIAGVIGGILLGISLAITFKSGATTGGVDIIIKVLRLKWRHIKTNIFFLLSDSIVIFAAWLIYQNMTVAFYAGIAVFVNSIVMDYVLYGPDEAKMIYIITDDPDRIKNRILDELDITATIIDAKGAYTEKTKKIVMSVMRKQIAPLVEEVVKEEDPTAFMIVSSASEIFGNGYKDIRKSSL